MEKKTITIPEAAKILGIGRSAAYEAARKSELPTIRIGRRLLVPLARLQRLLDPLAQPHLLREDQTVFRIEGSKDH